MEEFRSGISQKHELQRRRCEEERAAELRSVKMVQQQIDVEQQAAVEVKRQLQAQGEVARMANNQHLQMREAQRIREREQDIELNKEHARRLEKAEQDRARQLELTYARCNQLVEAQSGTSKAVDAARSAEEAMFLRSLQELEELDNRREHERQNKVIKQIEARGLERAS